MARDLVGSWIRIEATTILGPDGGAATLARLADTRGDFGTATQSLVIERRLSA